MRVSCPKCCIRTFSSVLWRYLWLNAGAASTPTWAPIRVATCEALFSRLTNASVAMARNSSTPSSTDIPRMPIPHASTPPALHPTIRSNSSWIGLPATSHNRLRMTRVKTPRRPPPSKASTFTFLRCDAPPTFPLGRRAVHTSHRATSPAARFTCTRSPGEIAAGAAGSAAEPGGPKSREQMSHPLTTSSQGTHKRCLPTTRSGRRGSPHRPHSFGVPKVRIRLSSDATDAILAGLAGGAAAAAAPPS
mmetsp:Transcript_29290/g.76785  ORF Transcript_29290/g.76785 Transcript_29290/m.76785 type:complete len:248 (+) Transcript_29290:708-1451(+)